MSVNPGTPGQDATTTAMAYQQIHDRLFGLVEMVLFGPRNVRETARQLAGRPLSQQQLFIDGVELIARNSVELAYFFCELAVPALEQLPAARWQGWVVQLMDCYDSNGLSAATGEMEMQKVERYVESLRGSENSVPFDEARRVLEPFLIGLNGRSLRLVADPERVFTDTESLFLPELVSKFADRDDNFRLYKAMLVHQWAQSWYGSWRHSLSQALTRFDDADVALALFHGLERVRLDGCICRDLPGMGREMAALRELQGEPPTTGAWRAAVQRLQRAEASVDDSLQLLGELYGQLDAPPACCYQGELRPELTEPVLQSRQLADKDQLALLLRDLLDEHNTAHADADADTLAFSIDQGDDPEGPDGIKVELILGDESLPISPGVQDLLNSIVQDIGDIPEEYLQAAGSGELADSAEGANSDPVAPLDDQQCVSYDEWDHVRGQYRKQWCLLQEREAQPQWSDFVPDTLNKYRGIVKQLRRSFEALRGQDRRMRKQPYGDDVDLDALVESLADQSAGLEASDNVFIHHQRIDRDIAVLFMVDMSGSTRGWINQTEREALVLLCESLQTLGDRYAVYGFSSNTRKRCEVLRIKDFDEDYSALVKARISGIEAREYTRMGVVIRHLTGHLQQTGARTRLLITLSDGRPDDIDGYRGSYGIEDTRQAVLEAHAVGVHPFCITIDDEGMDYLPHMFGPSGFTVVNRVERLPFKLSDIYRRLTM